MFNYDTGQTLILALFHFASSDFDTKITWKDWLNLNDSLSDMNIKVICSFTCIPFERMGQVVS